MSTSSTPSPVVVSDARIVGRVKWFNNKSGFGFITLCEGDDNDIFVHYTCLRAENSQYKYLVQGEYVEFDLVKSEDNKHEFHAANVSGIKGGLLMCQTHSLNNTFVRSPVIRPRNVYNEDNVGPPRERRLVEKRENVGDVSQQEGFTEIKRRSAPRKRVVGASR